MDNETVDLLANTLYQTEMIKELQKADQSITEEQARELVRNNMRYAIKESSEARKTVEAIIPIILGPYIYTERLDNDRY